MPKRGSQGGNATCSKYGSEYMKQLGKRGGIALVAKMGEKHLSEIGKRGGATTAKKYFNKEKRKKGMLNTVDTYIEELENFEELGKI